MTHAHRTLNWLYYWNVTRRARRLPNRLARLLLTWLRRAAYVVVAADATTGPLSSSIVPEVTVLDVMKSWDRD